MQCNHTAHGTMQYGLQYRAELYRMTRDVTCAIWYGCETTRLTPKLLNSGPPPTRIRGDGHLLARRCPLSTHYKWMPETRKWLIIVFWFWRICDYSGSHHDSLPALGAVPGVCWSSAGSGSSRAPGGLHRFEHPVGRRRAWISTDTMWWMHATCMH